MRKFIMKMSRLSIHFGTQTSWCNSSNGFPSSLVFSPFLCFIIFCCKCSALFGWHQLNWRRQRSERLPNSVTLRCKPREIREMSLNLVVFELFIPAVNEVSASHCCTRPVSTLKLHEEELNMHLWIICSYVWELSHFWNGYLRWRQCHV